MILCKCNKYFSEKEVELISTFISMLPKELKLFMLNDPTVVHLPSITAAFPCKTDLFHSYISILYFNKMEYKYNALYCDLTTLDSYSFSLVYHYIQLDSYSILLDSHSISFDSHSILLDSHSDSLDSHSISLDSHSILLDSHSTKLDYHSILLDYHLIKLDSQFFS